MESGQKVEIISVSRGQQYDDFRPVNIGDKGTLLEKYTEDVWYLNIKDPKDGKNCRIWFHEFDLKIIK